MNGIKLDSTINLGTLINVVLILVAMIAGFTSFQNELSRIARQSDEHAASVRRLEEISAKMSILIEEQQRRLQRLEDKVYGK